MPPMTERHSFVLSAAAAAVFLGSCTASVGPSALPAPSSASSASIEAYPAIQTVEHFATMALSGTDLTMGNILERTDAFTKRFVTYKSNGVRISGVFLLPSGNGPFPLAVLNHGYIDPKVYVNGRGLRREQEALARAGFAVLHIDYRGHAQSDADPDPRNVYDNALRYALDSANAVLAVSGASLESVDASRTAMLGHSMGGGVTLHVAVAHPELLDAVILYAPVNDDAWKNFKRWRADSPESAATTETLGTGEENPASWFAMSQTDYLDRIDDPVLLFQGLKDKDVPRRWSDDLDQKLETAGTDVRYVTYPEEGHEFGETWDHFMNTTIEFLNQHIQR